MVIFIFDKFFIQLSDSIINFLVSISNFFLSIFEKDNDFKEKEKNETNQFDSSKYGEMNYFNNSNSDNLNYSDNSNSRDDFKNENYSFISNLNLSKLFNNGNIFEYLENKYLNNQSMFISTNNINPNENKDNKNILSNLKTKIVVLILNNRFFQIRSSQDLLKLLFYVFLIIIFFSILIAVFVSFELSIAFLMFFILFALFILYLPKIRHENDYSSISKELPYALRQLSTELRAGKSLFDALYSIVDSDYGVLSREFSRVLEEIKYGETSENAFLNLEKRVNSKALSRVIYEILASLRIGSNLSSSLNIIAEDVNFDMRMKLKEYSEKLNAFIMIYTFLAILAPVIILTMLLAASVVIGDIVPSSLLFILYGLFFPMIIVFLAFAIKKLEPKL